MGNARDIVVRALPGVTPDQARDARARCWIYVLDVWNKKVAGPTPESDSRDKCEKLANEERSQRDLRQNAILDAEGDRTEQTRKYKHGFVHR
jgi:hypothetical protein